MRRVTKLSLVLAAAAATLSSCSDARNDFGAPPIQPGEAETVIEGDGWEVEIIRDDGGLPCWWIRLGSKTSGCLPGEQTDGGFSWRVLRGSSRSFVWFTTGPTDGTMRFFSSLHDGTTIDTSVVDGSRIAVFELEDGEEPWGFQWLDADGTLIIAGSFINF